MKEALDSEGLRPFLMAQPLGYKTPDTGSYGWITLPDYPFGKNYQLSVIAHLSPLSPGAPSDHPVGGGEVCSRGL